MELVILIAALGVLGVFLTLAYAGEDNEPLRYLVYVVLAAADLFLMLIGATLTLAMWVGMETIEAGMPQPPPGQPEIGFGDFLSLGPLWLGLAVLGFFLFMRPIRASIARFTAIDPDRLVHLVALHYAILVGVFASLNAVAISAFAETEAGLEQLQQVSDVGLADVWAQAAGFVIVAFLGVGLFWERGIRETLERLGVEPRISWRWALGVPVLGLISGYVVDFVWRIVAPETLEQVSNISEALFGNFLEAGLLGALTLGLSAGIGEELLFRGAAQPRLGLGLTSFLFAVIHTQYTVSPALIQVFILAVALGLARMRSNTTTAIVGHAVYNATLVILALYAPEVSP